MLSRLMTRREQFILGFFGLAIIAGAGGLFWSKRASSSPLPLVVDPAVPPARAVPDTIPAAAPAAAPQREIAVSVQGAVAAPGVYRFDEDSRIQDLIAAAGGFRGADTSDINLAARLIDGTTLTVPKRMDTSSELQDGIVLEPAPINPAAYTISGQGALASAATPASGGTGLIDINRATQAELETLPGIGPKLAQQIIQYRTGQPFADVSEMMEVPGIGPQRFEAIRELITVQ